MRTDAHAEGMIYALWMTDNITDEDRASILNEYQFLFRRAVDRYLGRGPS